MIAEAGAARAPGPGAMSTVPRRLKTAAVYRTARFFAWLNGAGKRRAAVRFV